MTMFDIDLILSELDDDNSGQVCFKEFLVTVVQPNKLLTRDKISEEFRKFDSDGSGSLSVAELQDIVSPNKQIDPAVLRMLLELDDDEVLEDVQIAMNEFRSFLVNCFENDHV